MGFYLTDSCAAEPSSGIALYPQKRLPPITGATAGLRSYSPNLSRWLSRDPIGERGELNLYGMVGNDAVNWADYLGLQEVEKQEQTEDCTWTLVFGHASKSGLEQLNEWWKNRPATGYPHSQCGNHKIGFATCSFDWMNQQVPEENRLPFTYGGIKDAGPYPQEEYENFRRGLEQQEHLRHLPRPQIEQLRAAETSLLGDMDSYNSVVDSANKQCEKRGNCCRTIRIDIRCPQLRSDINEDQMRYWKGDPEAFRGTQQAFLGQNEPRSPDALFNPCTKQETVTCAAR